VNQPERRRRFGRHQRLGGPKARCRTFYVAAGRGGYIPCVTGIGMTADLTCPSCGESVLDMGKYTVGQRDVRFERATCPQCRAELVRSRPRGQHLEGPSVPAETGRRARRQRLGTRSIDSRLAPAAQLDPSNRRSCSHRWTRLGLFGSRVRSYRGPLSGEPTNRLQAQPSCLSVIPECKIFVMWRIRSPCKSMT
jgi:hypothetical protein